MTNASLSIFVLILNHLLDTEDGESALGLASVMPNEALLEVSSQRLFGGTAFCAYY